MRALALDPDQFLDLAGSTPPTREEGRAAWDQAYAALAAALAQRGAAARLFLVFGLQGGGKSHWVGQQLAAAAPSDVFFSGPLPSRRHRARALGIARAAGCPVTAVWIDAPLALALQRNAARSGLARVPEDVIQHVHESLEPPAADEGFAEIVRVPA
jgi:hypothetical protein